MEASSIGIIGGADGPTAIYTTVNYSPAVNYIILAVCVLALAYIIYLIKKKK